MPASPDPGKEGGANAVDHSAIVEAKDSLVSKVPDSNMPQCDRDLLSEKTSTE